MGTREKKMTTESGSTRRKAQDESVAHARAGHSRAEGIWWEGTGTARVGTCGAIPASPVVSDDPVSVNTAAKAELVCWWLHVLCYKGSQPARPGTPNRQAP